MINSPAHSYTDIGYGGVQLGNVYTYLLYAVDGGGNYSNPATATVDVYRGPPLTLNGGTTAYTNSSSYALTGQTDPSAALTVNGNTVTVNSDGSFSYSAALTGSQTTFTVIATLGGSSHTLQQQVTLDTSIPTCSYWYPSDSTVVFGHKVQISANFYDSGTGIASTVLQVSRDDGITWINLQPTPASAGEVNYFYWDTTSPVGTSKSPLADGSYKFRLAGYDYAGNAGYSSVHVWTIDNTPPAVPQGISAVATLGKVTLTWTANSEPDLDGYNVYRSTTSGSGYVQVGSTYLSNGNSTTYTDTSAAMTAAVPFYYVVTAFDNAYNESAYSTAVKAQPVADTTAPTLTSYPWMGTTGTTTIGPSYISSSWYTWIYATDNSPQGVQNFTFGLSADNGATWTYKTYPAYYNGQQYYFTYYLSNFGYNFTQGNYLLSFSAKDYSGNSSTPATVSISLYLAISAPQNLKATRGQGSVILTWDPVNNPNLTYYPYQILRSTYITGGFTSMGSTNQTTCTFTDSSVTLGKTYYYMVSCTDTYGNTANSSVVSGQGADDLIPPNMISITPASGATTGGPQISFNIMASDNKSVASVSASYSSDGGATWTPIGTGGANLYTTLPNGDKEYSASLGWSTAGLAPGAYQVSVTATDQSGNVSTPMVVTWSLDLSVSAPANLQATPEDGSVYLTWNAITDPDVRPYSTYHVWRSAKSGGPYSTDIGWANQSTPGISDATDILASTTYYYVVDSYDSFGNTARSQELAVTTLADTTPPYITSISPATGVTIGGLAPIEFDVKFKDDYALDNAKVLLDYSGDGTSWTAIGQAYFSSNTGAYTTYWYLTTVGSGADSVRFSVYDSAGNLSRQTFIYQVDRTAPSAPQNLAAIYGNGEIGLTWQAPPEASVDHYNINRANQDTGPYTQVGQAQGRSNVFYDDTTVKAGLTYFYEVTAVDKFSQESAVSNIAKAAAVTDITPPVIQGIDPADGTLLGPQDTITVVASDNVALASITLQYTLNENGTDWINIDTIATQDKAVFQWAPPSGLDGATVLVRAIAEDSVGNLSDGTPGRGYIVDTQGPAQVTGVVYSNLTGTGVLLNWNDVPDNDFNFFVVQRKDSPSGDYEYITSSGGLSPDLSLADKISTARGLQITGLQPEATYWFRVVAYDKLGNRGAYSDDLQVTTAGDTTPPWFNTFSPLPGMFSQAIAIEAGAADDVSVASVTIQYSSDQSTWSDLYTKTFSGIQTVANAVYQWDVSSLPEGSYYVRAAATDTSGNTGYSSSYQYIIDHTPPSTPTGLTATATAGYVDLNWNQNPEQDLGSYRVYRATSAAGPYTLQTGEIYDGDSGGKLYRDRNVVPGAAFYYEVTAVDLAGNESVATAPVSASLQQDTTPPTIVGVAPESNQVLAANPTIRVLATDDYKVAQVKLDYQPDGSQTTWSPVGSQSFDSYLAEPYFTWNTAGLTDGRYVVRVSATDEAGNVSVPDYVYYTLNLAPPAAPVLTATNTKGGFRIDLSWTSGHESDLAGFILMRHAPGGQFTVIAQLKGASYSDAPVDAGTLYTYMVEAEDTYGNISQSNPVTLEATTVDTTPPVAVASVDQTVVTTGMEAGFDGTQSTDNDRVASYLWDFGDGSPTSNIALPSHAYSDPGAYTVTLWVYDPAGNVSLPGTCQVKVVSPEQMGTVKVQVVDDVTGAPLPGADVLIQFPDGSTQKSTSNGLGLTSIVAAPGDYKVYAFKNNYKPAEVDATLVQDQQTTINVRLKPGSLVVGQLTVTRMTLDEIVAAGIDINAPENQFVYKFEVHLAFNNTPLPAPAMIINGDGDIEEGGAPIYFTDSDGDAEVAEPEAIPYPNHPEVQPTLAYLVIPGEAHWLKEFFNVGLSLQNTADPQFVIDNSSATLQLPDGLSLAPTSNRQNLQVALGSIAGGDSRQVNWIIRGDQKGFYNLQALFSGILEPFGDQVSTLFRTKTPFRVWGGDALKMHIVAQDRTDKDYPYNISFGLENVSDHDVYNLSFFLKDHGKQNYIYAPNQDLTVSIMDLPPGQTLWKSYQLIPSIEGDLDLSDSYVLQTGGNTDVQSDFTSVTVPENAVGTAPVLRQTNKWNGTVDLSWDPVDGAKEYKIYRVRDDLDISMDPGELVYTAQPSETSINLPEPDGPQDYVMNTVVDTVYGEQEILRHAMTGVAWQSKAGLPVITVDPETIPVNFDSKLLITVNSQGFPVAGGTVDIGSLVTGSLLDGNGQTRVTVHPLTAGNLVINAYDPDHNLLSSLNLPVFTPSPPKAPTGLKAVPQNGTEAQLTWDPNKEQDMASYNVYELANDRWQKLNTGTVTSVTYAVYSLSYDNTYYFEVTAVNQESLESGYSLPASAAMGAAPDAVPPWVVATGPQDSAVDAPTNVQINVDLSKQVQPGPNFSSIAVSAGGTPAPFVATTKKKFLILTPDSALPENTPCVVTVPAGAVQDLAGNGLANGYSFSFTTDSPPETASPVIETTNPQDNAVNVSLRPAIRILFSDPVQEGDNFDSLALTANGVSEAFTASIDDHTLTVTPYGGLPAGASCLLTVPGGAVKNLAGYDLQVASNLAFDTAAPGNSTGATVTPSSDATLSSLIVSAGELNPAFSSSQTSYTASVDNSVASITVTPTVNESHASCVLQLSGNTVTNPISLAAGDNNITILVTAQDGTIETYSLTVTKQTSTGAVTPVAPAGGGGGAAAAGGGGGAAPTASNEQSPVATPVPPPAPVPPTPAAIPAAPSFKDMTAGYWADDEIVYLQAAGIVSGYPDGTYRPNDPITRAEFCAIIDKALNLTPYAQSSMFTDVNTGDWCYQAVETAVYAGIAKGYGNGTFRPDSPVTRQELVAVIMQAWHYLGNRGAPGSSASLNSFRDADEISPWARPAAAGAVALGLVSGMEPGLFEPLETGSRAQVAVLIYKLLRSGSGAAIHGEGN
jgi:fibronectin type 3 domain-containing protein